MAAMTAESQWTARKSSGKNAVLGHGDLTSTLSFDEANEFASEILGITGYTYTPGMAARNNSKVAAPKGKAKKKAAKGGKC